MADGEAALVVQLRQYGGRIEEMCASSGISADLRRNARLKNIGYSFLPVSVLELLINPTISGGAAWPR